MEDIIKYAMLLIYGLCVLIGYLVKASIKFLKGHFTGPFCINKLDICLAHSSTLRKF